MGFAIKTEILLFLSTATVTLAVMVAISWILPANPAVQARTDAFLLRIQMPIGDLPEDQESTSMQDVISPFRVVGISVVLIGLLMLCVLPWVPRGFDFQLAAILGLLLVLIGGLAAWGSGRKASSAS